jgi:hypothetical protein
VLDEWDQDTALGKHAFSSYRVPKKGKGGVAGGWEYIFSRPGALTFVQVSAFNGSVTDRSISSFTLQVIGGDK